eukprot:TRINITY_DN91043_c0_g1_i1.p1 TRINITY_DN91043_c0_g1~~TRINITY_DN91043_c0_g1_i1.p1  ORF type:complete len:323 (+),score=89.76 TRINITY_DN91043_c0_g1_i1:61-969(+)
MVAKAARRCHAVALGLVCLSFSCQALSPPAASASRRLLSDDEVLANQRFYSLQWRKRFNAGDVIYCGQAFVEDASLHVSFGPLAETVKSLVYLSNPAVLHGQVPIEAFWNASQIVLGFKDMKAYADEGEYASSAVVVDDNVVMVSSPVEFAAKAGTVKGQMRSEMWVRVGQQWKLRSMMFAIEEVKDSSAVPALPTKDWQSALGVTAKEPASPKADAAPALVVSTAAPSSQSEAAPADTSAVNQTLVAAETEKTPEPAPSGQHRIMLLSLMVALIVGTAALFARRAKNRREAAISGFESMLG